MEEIILELAKTAILIALHQPTDFNLTQARQDFPKLNEKGAVFVTLRSKPNHELRGCIGSLHAFRPLYKDIILNAQSSALKDSRFKPLQQEELATLELEVSLLSKAKVLDYNNTEELQKKIRPNIDGIILTQGVYRATYLPSVWEILPKFHDFFESLCQKAGLEKNCLKRHPKIEHYQVEKYTEN